MEALVMIVLLFALLVVGIPIAFSIGLSVLCVLTITDVPLMIFAQRYGRSLKSASSAIRRISSSSSRRPAWFASSMTARAAFWSSNRL